MFQRKSPALSGPGRGSPPPLPWWGHMQQEVRAGGPGRRKLAVAGVAREGGSWARTNSAGGCGAWRGQRCRMLRVRVTEGAGCAVKETRVSPPGVWDSVGYYCRGGAGSRGAAGRVLRPGGKSKAAVDSPDRRRLACFHCCLGECLVIIGWFVLLWSFVG